MNGELRFLKQSNKYCLDYYENLVDVRDVRMELLRQDLVSIFKYTDEVFLEVYAYNINKELLELSEQTIYKPYEFNLIINNDTGSNADPNDVFCKPRIKNIDEFTVLLKLLTDISGDFTIDDATFHLDEKRQMWFNLTESVYKVVDF